MNKEIKSIEFVFENCECIEIPFNCFTKLEIKDLDNLKEGDAFKSLECIIEDKGGTKYLGFDGFSNLTPLQRINQYNDITSIYINYTDKTTLHLYCPWYYENEYDNSQNNEFQTSKMESFNKVELNIINNSKWFTLNEILNKSKDGDIIKDIDGKLYEVGYNEDEGIYLNLPNEHIARKLLSNKFQTTNCF